MGESEYAQVVELGNERDLEDDGGCLPKVRLDVGDLSPLANGPVRGGVFGFPIFESNLLSYACDDFSWPRWCNCCSPCSLQHAWSVTVDPHS